MDYFDLFLKQRNNYILELKTNHSIYDRTRSPGQSNYQMIKVMSCLFLTAIVKSLVEPAPLKFLIYTDVERKSTFTWMIDLLSLVFDLYDTRNH